MAAIAGIEHLGEAGGARRQIGENPRELRASRFARPDLEGRHSFRHDPDMLQVRDHRRRGPLEWEPPDELLEAVALPLELDRDAAVVVADPPGKPQLRREPEHERPEPDPLDGAADPDP